jgi:hypothetical protein
MSPGKKQCFCVKTHHLMAKITLTIEIQWLIHQPNEPQKPSYYLKNKKQKNKQTVSFCTPAYTA